MTIINAIRRPLATRHVTDVPLVVPDAARSTTAPTHDPASHPDGRTLSRWGLDIELDGITAHEDVARIVADAARDAGVRPVLVAVLSNPCEPAAARARAFGRLSLVLDG